MKKKLIFLLSLCIVTTIAFASATYAWFSDQYNPYVDDLGFTIETRDYMLVSKSGLPGEFRDDVKFSDMVSDRVTLKPLEGHVGENSISITNNGEVATSNYIKFTLYFSASKDMSLYLDSSTGGGVLGFVDHYANQILTQTQVNEASKAIRIGFLAYQLIETPDSGGNIQTTQVPSYTNVYSISQRADSDYVDNVRPYDTYSTLGYKGGLSGDTVLLEVDSLKVSKLDVYIWLEGRDKACVENQVIGVKLEVDLTFYAHMNSEEGDE